MSFRYSGQSPAGEKLTDLDFTADRHTPYDAGACRWFEMSGAYRERRVVLRVAGGRETGGQYRCGRPLGRVDLRQVWSFSFRSPQGAAEADPLGVVNFAHPRVEAFRRSGEPSRHSTAIPKPIHRRAMSFIHPGGPRQTPRRLIQ
jgi:hypothetical protein